MWPSWPLSVAVLWTIPAALCSSQPLCPAPCTADPSTWTPYKSFESFKDCHHSVLLDFSSHAPKGSLEPAFSIHACTVDGSQDAEFTDLQPLVADPETQTGTSISASQYEDRVSARQLNLLLDHVQKVLTRSPNRETRSALGRLRTIAVGIHNGLAANETLMTTAIERLRTENDFWARGTTVIQLCGRDRNADHTFGIALDTTGDTAAVHQAVESWARGRCAESESRVFDARDLAATEDVPVGNHSAVEEMRDNLTISAVKQPLYNVTLPMLREKMHHEPPHVNNKPQYNVTQSRMTNEIGQQQLTCVTETVRLGDTCADLAKRCGVTGDDFMTFNPQEGLCTWLRPGEEVCCSPKIMKEGIPKMNEDGSCAAYLTKEEDSCASIASSHGLEKGKISYFNDGRTWGWSGCDLIHAGLKICLSEGYPPLPPPRTGASCGPTVPGTEMPADGTPLAALNPCPLNACCNTRGNCGVSPDYCIFEEGPTGNPGTAPKGRMGCISNCGLDILDNSEAPAEFMRIGYYESFNLDRPCLNLRAAHIKVNDYTHIHWGFATVDHSFRVGVNDTHKQWPDFLALQGVKRILSFGGWGYTVNGEVYDVLREAMKPENVDTFIVNIMEFVQDNGLDGVDFDWEYPGASAFPSVSAGLHSDGPNYLAFLKKLRKIFPRDKSVSMAAPASYWHLKVFPIAEMWQHLDYVIYMTYDFHGQWDYESSFYVQDWCEGGNCLRSHVNLTETEYALAMITKAGVPRSAIAVGVASYGRAFGMADPECTKPDCKFKGPETAAIPGMCTRTPGVLAIAEIEALMIEGDINESYYDPASDSNILVYNDTQWVGFMSKSTMRRRVEYYRSLKFAGYANWAVDLTHWSGDDIEPEEQLLDFFVLGNVGPAA